MTTKIKNILLLIFVILATIACNDNNDDADINTSSSALGTLSVKLTDAPFPSDLVAEANVTINKIEVRKDADSLGNPFIILSEDEFTFNLLELTNGVTASLVNLEIDTGAYDLVRLYVSDANVVLNDSTIYDLDIPSGSQTGIKVFISPSIQVVGGLTTELLLDFDVSQSFIVKGNSNTPAGIKGFIFKPTIKASNLSTSGSLAGTITDSLNVGIDGALISIFADDTLNTSTLSDSNGAYTFLGLDAGTYDIDVEYSNYQTVTVENINIAVGNQTIQDVQLIE